jgi:hypothetical protein
LWCCGRGECFFFFFFCGEFSAQPCPGGKLMIDNPYLGVQRSNSR